MRHKFAIFLCLVICLCIKDILALSGQCPWHCPTMPSGETKPSPSTDNSPMPKKIVCYTGIRSWSANRDFDIALKSQFLKNPNLCSHIIYANATLHENGTIDYSSGKGGIAKVISLKRPTNGLKVLLMIGGSKTRSRFSLVFHDATKKDHFISSTIFFLRKYDFDGINLDWQFPREGNDKANFVDVIRKMRIAFEKEAKETKKETMLITITLPSNETEAKGYDVAKLDPNVDFYCMLTYDYSSEGERSANHHSPLFRSTEISSCNTKAHFDADHFSGVYENKGATPSKLILGIPAYGKCVTLENKDYHKTGSPTIGEYKEKPCDGESLIPYFEICKAVQNNRWNWTTEYSEPCNVGPYGYGNNGNKTFWIGYDNEKMAEQKGIFVSKKNLGGVSFWALEDDDFQGLCNGTKFPLIKAASRGLQENSIQCTDFNQPSSSSSDFIDTKLTSDNKTSLLHFEKDKSKEYNPYRLASHNIYTGIWGVFSFILGIFGNCLTLIAIPYAARHKRHNLHRHWYTATIFIMNLAIFDIGFCIFGMPHEILLHLGIGWPFGNISCKIFHFLEPIFAYGDWYALALIAVTRALAVVKHKQWEQFCRTRNNVILLIAGCWILNIVLCIPRLYPTGKEYGFNEYSGLCQNLEQESTSSGTEVSFSLTLLQRMPHYIAFALATLTMLISYFGIWRHVRSSRKNMKDVRKYNKGSNRDDLRLTVTLVIISILFIICILPLTLLEQFTGQINYNGVISIYWAQYSINVIVYAARRDAFWKAYLDIFIRVLNFFGLKKVVEMANEMTVLYSKRSKNETSRNQATNTIPPPSGESESQSQRPKNKADKNKVTNTICPLSGDIIIESNKPSKKTLSINATRSIMKVMDNEDNHSFIDACMKPKALSGHSPDPNEGQCHSSGQQINSNQAPPESSATTKSKSHIKCSYKSLLSAVFVAVVILCVVTLFALMFTVQKSNNKLLILGGYTARHSEGSEVCSGLLDNVEVIDLERSSERSEGLVEFSSHLHTHTHDDHDDPDQTKFLTDNFPKLLTDASGTILDNVPLVCGGINENWKASKSCFKMVSLSKWQPIANMTIERSHFSSTLTKKGFLVVGGLDRGRRVVDSVEMLPTIGSTNFTPKNRFATSIRSGCMASVDDNTVILVGGFLDGFELTNKTWKYDIGKDKWSEMQPMKFARAEHGCTTVKHAFDGKTKVVVAGGTIGSGDNTESVEIYNVEDQIWKEGPDLPFPIGLSQLIGDGINGGALLIGGRVQDTSGSKRLKSIIHLPNDLKEWKQLGRGMKSGRASHVAMLLPKTIELHYLLLH